MGLSRTFSTATWMWFITLSLTVAIKFFQTSRLIRASASIEFSIKILKSSIYSLTFIFLTDVIISIGLILLHLTQKLLM